MQSLLSRRRSFSSWVSGPRGLLEELVVSLFVGLDLACAELCVPELLVVTDAGSREDFVLEFLLSENLVSDLLLNLLEILEGCFPSSSCHSQYR